MPGDDNTARAGGSGEIDTLQSKIDVVRARLSSLNANLSQSAVERMATAGTGSSPPPFTGATSTPGAHTRYKAMLTEDRSRYINEYKAMLTEDRSRYINDSGVGSGAESGMMMRSPQQQRQVETARSDAKWRMQQEMLSRQLEEFRRGGGEADSFQQRQQHQCHHDSFAQQQPSSSAAMDGGGGNAFAEMQKRLRSKLAAMGSGALSPAPGSRQQQQFDAEEHARHARADRDHAAEQQRRMAEAQRHEREQREEQQRRDDEQRRRATEHERRPASAAVRARDTGTDAPDADAGDNNIGVAGEEVFASRSNREPGARNLAASFAGATGRVSSPGPSASTGTPSLRTAGGFKSPSLIGGLVGRFGRDQQPQAEAVASTATRGAQRQRSATTPPKRTTTAPATTQPQPPLAEASSPRRNVGAQEIDVSGAEVFAILRMRGVISSTGQTGEHLLPAALCHRMTLSSSELQQLQQLRESLRRQSRNSPRGAARASPAATAARRAGDPPSLRSTEAAMSVTARKSPAATTRTTSAARRTANGGASAATGGRVASGSVRSTTPSAANGSPPRPRPRWN